jgi:ribonuclease HI
VISEIIKKLWMSNVTLYWISGHTEIMSNEEADKLAKAATGPDRNRISLDNLYAWNKILDGGKA